MPNPALSITVAWFDDDLQEVIVSASSAGFAGRVSLYAAPEELIAFADCIRGFPNNSADRREFTVGQDNLSTYGTVRFSFYPADSLGHVVCAVSMRVVGNSPEQLAEAATVHVPATAGAIDRFEAQLRGLAQQIGESATLSSAA